MIIKGFWHLLALSSIFFWFSPYTIRTAEIEQFTHFYTILHFFGKSCQS